MTGDELLAALSALANPHRLRIVAAYAVGCVAALLLWSVVRFVPSRPLALIALGASPFLLHLLPRRWRPEAENPRHGAACGAASMSLMLLTGVAGPLLDSFFLGGRLDRRAIVATKAACQVLGHALKLAYFGSVIADPGSIEPAMAAAAILASMLGTMLARRLLEAMTDQQFRLWAGRIVTIRASRSGVEGDAVTLRARAGKGEWRTIRVAPFDADAATAGPLVCAPMRAGLTVRFTRWAFVAPDVDLHEDPPAG